jgi:Transposase IS4
MRWDGINIEIIDTPIFSGENPGPQSIPDHCKLPMDFFLLFFPAEMGQRFAEYTNEYGTNNFKDWDDVNELDILGIVMIIITMGLKGYSDIHDYWTQNPIFRNTFISKLCSRDRFKEIWSALHYVPKNDAASRDDPFYLVSQWLQDLNDLFMKHFIPSQRVDIDEICVFFKGHHKCRCYNPNKPAKFHLKFFGLNDAKTGYLTSFFPYRGAGSERDKSTSATAFPVKELTKHPVFHDKGYILNTDNWYTSRETCTILAGRGIYAQGTIKTNKRFLPIFVKFPKSTDRGRMRCWEADLNSEFKLRFVQWMDNKQVTMVTTLPVHVRSVQRMVNEGNKKNKLWVYKAIPQPTCIADYNKGMGGTDLNDQMAGYYRMNHKTRKWPHRVFSHFFSVMIANALVLFNEFQRSRGLPIVSKKEFTMRLINEIVDWLLTKGPPLVEVDEIILTSKKPGSSKTWKKWPDRVIPAAHTPLGGCNARLCKWLGCGKQVRSICVECDVHLCLPTGSENYKDSCWWKSHHESA